MEAPRTPAQWFATVMGVVLIAFGVLALVVGSTNFGVADRVSAEEFILWRVNGWDTVLYMATGALGLLLAARVDAARSWALLVGIVYATVAVWGFIDGRDVFGLLAVDTTDNISHAAIGGVGLVLGLLPESTQRRVGAGGDRDRRSGGHAHPA